MAAQVPEFKYFLPFGRHRLPIDTGDSLFVQPRFEQGKQNNILCVRVKTSVGFADFELSLDTLEKTQQLVAIALEHNLKWCMVIAEVRPSLKNRTIDLIFDPSISLGSENGKKLHWGDLFLMFQRILGLASPFYDTAIVKTDDGKTAVRLAFKDHNQMKPMLVKFDNAIENRQIARLLVGNPDFEIAAHVEPIVPMEQDPREYPLFDVTPDTITSRNRVGGGQGPWIEADIPLMLKNYKEALAIATKR